MTEQVAGVKIDRTGPRARRVCARSSLLFGPSFFSLAFFIAMDETRDEYKQQYWNLKNAPPLIVGGIKGFFCLMSVWRLSHTSGLSREQRGPGRPKNGTEVAHATRDSDITSRVKGQRSRSPGRFGWLFKSVLYISTRPSLRHRPEQAAACRSWIFMEQGALGARRVGYGLEVGRGVRTAGGAGRGILCRHEHSLLFVFCSNWFQLITWQVNKSFWFKLISKIINQNACPC